MATKRSVRSVLNLVMLGLFVLSAIAQYNDPDAGIWMAMYGAAAVVCLLHATRRVSWLVPTLVGGVALTWAASLMPAVIGRVGFGELFASMQMHDPRVELGRELGGLLIVAGWMAVLAVTARRRPAS